jgi:hypothetical protein
MYLNEFLNPAFSLSLGATIGFAFGNLQNAAQKRHEQRQSQTDKLNNGWTNVPGSMTRVALLLGSLGVAQLLLPALFTGGNQWSVSAGVIAGYAVPLWTRFRERRAAGR